VTEPKKKSAGVYMLTGPWRLRVARAWECKACHVSWYDYRHCPHCGKDGMPEKLPDSAKIVEHPEL